MKESVKRSEVHSGASMAGYCLCGQCGEYVVERHTGPAMRSSTVELEEALQEVHHSICTLCLVTSFSPGTLERTWTAMTDEQYKTWKLRRAPKGTRIRGRLPSAVQLAKDEMFGPAQVGNAAKRSKVGRKRTRPPLRYR